MALILAELSLGSLVKLSSFVFWGILYLSYALSEPDKSPEWSSRIITTIHSTVCSVIGVCQCFLSYPNHFFVPVTPSQYALMAWSWGYFVFDLYWCFVFGNESLLILSHHAIAIVSITKYMNKPNTGCTFACAMVLLEITNPLLQTRWFLRKHGQGKTLLFTIIEVIFMALFIFLRGVVGTWLIYKLINSQKIDKESKTLAVILYVMSLIFILEMLSFVNYKYKTKFLDLTRWYAERSGRQPTAAANSEQQRPCISCRAIWIPRPAADVIPPSQCTCARCSQWSIL